MGRFLLIVLSYTIVVVTGWLLAVWMLTKRQYAVFSINFKELFDNVYSDAVKDADNWTKYRWYLFGAAIGVCVLCDLMCGAQFKRGHTAIQKFLGEVEHADSRT